MTQSFAGQVREILKRLGKEGDVTYQAVALELDMITDREKQRLYVTLREFIRRGECVRVARGTVRYVYAKEPRPAKKTRCMFRLIRANRYSTVTAADLMANCGVSAKNARDYLNTLTKRGFMRRIDMPNNQPSKYQLINDPGPNLIRNDDNAAKLRRLRHAKQEALAQLDIADQSLKSATDALAQALRAVTTIEDKGETP